MERTAARGGVVGFLNPVGFHDAHAREARDDAGGDPFAARIDAWHARRDGDRLAGSDHAPVAHDDGAALDRRGAVTDDELGVGDRDALRGGRGREERDAEE